MKKSAAENTIKECEAMLNRIRELRIATERKAHAAQGTLQKIESELPVMYARHALGEITDDALTLFIAEKRSCETAAGNAPLIFRGLDTLESKTRKQHLSAIRTANALQSLVQYKKIANNILECYAPNLEADLWVLSTELGRQDEAAAIIRSAKRPKKHRKDKAPLKKKGGTSSRKSDMDFDETVMPD